jgi:long-subunit acyl-CoA synthetase (AMP-forming)
MSASTTTWPPRCGGAQLIADFAVEVRDRAFGATGPRVQVPTGTSGEIQARGHNVMKGYCRLPESAADAVVSEWFSTGDIGRVDEEAYFYIVARKRF